MADFLPQYWPAGLLLLQMLLAWFVWSMRREFVGREELQDMARRLESTEKSTAVLHEQLDGVPTHRDLVAMRDELGAVRTDLRGVVSQLDGMRELQQAHVTSLNRIHDYLLERKQ